jgi:hypothetical protein
MASSCLNTLGPSGLGHHPKSGGSVRSKWQEGGRGGAPHTAGWGSCPTYRRREPLVPCHLPQVRQSSDIIRPPAARGWMSGWTETCSLLRPGNRQAKAKGPMGEESPSTQHQRITGHCLALDPQSHDRVSSSPHCTSGHRRIALSAPLPRPMPSSSPALVVAAAAPLAALACRAPVHHLPVRCLSTLAA